MSTTAAKPILRTTAGEFPLSECRLPIGQRELSLLHTDAVLTLAEESRYLDDRNRILPFGVVLWPAAIALAHEIVTREKEFRAKRVLELGAGTGLPGLVAASLGASVVQTDRSELAVHVCRLNGERNRLGGIEYRIADWSEWVDGNRYDWIVGSDILYADTGHEHLRKIFDAHLAPGGRVLLSDPFRSPSLSLLERMEKEGWRSLHSRWSIGDRAVAVYELTPPKK